MRGRHARRAWVARVARIAPVARIAWLAGVVSLAVPGCNALLGLDPPPAPAGDAGAGDAAPRDAAFAPYWTFSDDFEVGDFRKWTKTATSTNGALDVVQTGGASGCCALHARVDQGDVGFQYALISWPDASPSAPPVTSGTIAVRARVKASQLDHDTRELSIAQGGTSPAWYTSAGLGAADVSGFAWGYILSDPANASFVRRSANVIDDALGGWHCVELVLNVGDGDGHVAIFLDDQPVPQLQSATSTAASTGWDSVTLGLGYTSGGAASELLLDDAEVALYHDMAPGIHIGCK